MFLRLKNQLDYNVNRDELKELISDDNVMMRIDEVLQILDDNYSSSRGSKSMGGYIYLYTNSEDYNTSISEMLRIQHLGIEDYEFSDVLSDKRTIWKEELYLVGSDDAITVIHPLEA